MYKRAIKTLNPILFLEHVKYAGSRVGKLKQRPWEMSESPYTRREMGKKTATTYGHSIILEHQFST
jgi:hypothetical protein